MKLVWRVLDVILGGLFIYAGVIKALDPVQFANDIDNYKTLPWFISVRLAFYLPWLELLCGLALIFRCLYRGGLSILSALTLIFLGATVAAKMRGLDISCGCFGHASQHWNFWQHMAVDLSILMGLVALWFSRSRHDGASITGATAALLLFALTQPLLASDKKEWVKLDNCTYVEAKDNDGDSFHVLAGGKEFTARLYFVDAPETNLRQGDRTRDQSLHFGITLDETMNAGEKAKQRVKELLQKPFVIWTRWATAGGRGRESRYYAIIEAEGKDLGEILVGEGLARTKGVSAVLPNGQKGKEHMERLDDLESAARQKRLGAWATSKTETASPSRSDKPSP